MKIVYALPKNLGFMVGFDPETNRECRRPRRFSKRSSMSGLIFQSKLNRYRFEQE